MDEENPSGTPEPTEQPHPGLSLDAAEKPTSKEPRPRTGHRRADAIAAAVIAAGGTRKQAAEKSGLSLRTIANRLNASDFKAMVTRYRSRLIDRALGSLSKGITKAAAKLVELVGDADAATAHRAAVAVLDKFASIRGAFDIEERLARLEEQSERQNAAAKAPAISAA